MNSRQDAEVSYLSCSPMKMYACPLTIPLEWDGAIYDPAHLNQPQAVEPNISPALDTEDCRNFPRSICNDTDDTLDSV